VIIKKVKVRVLSQVSSGNNTKSEMAKMKSLYCLIREAVKVDVIHGLPTGDMINKMKDPGLSVPVTAEELPVINPPDDLTEVGLFDLQSVIAQMSNPVTSPELAEVYDKHPLRFFKTFVESKGRSYNESYYKNIIRDLKPLIFQLKSMYNRPRPQQVANLYGLEFVPLQTRTSESPSYPSGHTIQSFVAAVLLAHQFPDLAEELLQIAELIAQSRVDAGVHFQSDIIFGRMLAALIAKGILDENFA